MKSKFGIVIWCFCAILLSSASCQDLETNESIAKEEVSESEKWTRAVVSTKFVDDGCEVLLEIEENGEKILLIPIELDDRYKVDGIEVLIQFSFSKIMQSKCHIGRPASIEVLKLVE